MVAVVLMGGIFILDLFVPLGIAVGALYVFAFLVVSRQSSTTIVVMAMASIVLLFAKLLLFFDSQTASYVFVNRSISIVVLVSTAIITLRHRSLLSALQSNRNTYIMELERMIYMTSHRVRQPLVTCMGLMNIVESENELTRQELQTVVKYLKDSAADLDDFTRELTEFIHAAHQRNEQYRELARKYDGEDSGGSSDLNLLQILG